MSSLLIPASASAQFNSIDANPMQSSKTKVDWKNAKRYYLDVPYKYKDEAKRLGAFYDASKKEWYSQAHFKNHDELIEMFSDETELRMYVDAPNRDFEGRREFGQLVKSKGAQFNMESKQWFFYRNNPNLSQFEKYEVEYSG